MTAFDEAIDRAFGRTEKVISAIEEGNEVAIHSSIVEMDLAQPWDMVAIGQGFVRDQIKIERDQDDGNRPS